MFKQRVYTAVIIAGLFLSGVAFLSGAWGVSFLGAVWLLGAYEWCSFASVTNRFAKLAYTGVTALLMYALYLLVGDPLLGYNEDILKPFLMTAVVCWAVMLLWVQSYPSSAVLWRSAPMVLLAGWVVVIPAWLSMAVLQAESAYGSILIFVLLIAVANDTGAYAVGKNFGKRKLAEKVSPKKTWEGLFGGVVFAIIIALVIAYAAGFEGQQFQAWMRASLAAIVAAIVGDLVESMFKREAGVKDSGVLLPGHGGFLDRLDSLSAAYPAFAFVYLFELS